jgi:hypothetical protein
MDKPRYDPKKNVSRHAATDEEKCRDMVKRNPDWELVDIEPIDVDIFKVDCVFKGDTNFQGNRQSKD